MEQEINEDEVLSDSQSPSTTRPSSSTSSDMPKVNLQSRSGSFSKRKSSNIDLNDLPQSATKQLKEQIPLKVLVFNGKCSTVFKSTLEDCVEDCILEFPEEKNSIYVSKSGHGIQVPVGSTRNSINSLREPSAASGRQSTRSNRQRSSINSQPQIGGVRANLTNNFSLPTTALAATAAVRMRHQLVQQKFSLVDDISEESTEQQTTIEQPPITTSIEPELRSDRPYILSDEPMSPNLNPKLSTASLPLFPYDIIPSTKTHMSYRDRQKDYRLSDLVMFGPEYYAHIFNLPRHHSQSRLQHIKTAEKSTELDRIKQDLFHRYLWTQKPQVSCRIRPISTYTRSTTFVT